MFLALKEADERSSIKEISECFSISHNHLMKVVQRLSGCGYVDGQRGKGGGVRLAMPAEQINIGTVVREFETEKAAVDCETGPCRFHGHCGLEGAVALAMQAFFDCLNDYCLADVLSNKDDLAQALLPLDKSIAAKLSKR